MTFRFLPALLLLLGGPLSLQNSAAQNAAEISPRQQNADADKRTYERRIYFKLPLAQPRFHWYFEDEETFLNGELTLTIQSAAGESLTFAIFDSGEVSEGWETKKGKRGYYFLFQSRNSVEVSRGDIATVTLRVREDLKGVGADSAGILRAGTYTSQGKFTIYDLEEASSDFAFLSKENWDPHWELDITSDKGWIEEDYDREKRPLNSSPESYLITISYAEDGTRSVSVIDHAAKEYYFESFRNHEVFLSYIKANQDQLPPHIWCSGRGEGFVPFCEGLQKELKSVQLSYFTEDGFVGDHDRFSEFAKAANYYKIYRTREK